MDITFHLIILNFVGFFSILRSFCSHFSLALCNLCYFLAICLAFASILNWVSSSTGPLQNCHQWLPATPRPDCLFSCYFFDLILSVLSPLNLWLLNFLRELSGTFVGCLDQNLPLPRHSRFLQRTPRDVQGRNIVAFTEAEPNITRGNGVYLDIC